MDPTRKIYLLRHGETLWSKTGQHTGLTDIDLTKEGEEEAKLLGKSLKGISFSHVFCSPLKRVRDTCHLAGLSKQAVYDQDLVEWDYGQYEGLTTPEIHKTDPSWSVFTEDPPGGESKELVTKRADRILKKVAALEGDIALFSSGHFSRVLGARWILQPASFGKHLFLQTASKSILGFEHGLPVLMLWNDRSHLCRIDN